MGNLDLSAQAAGQVLFQLAQIEGEILPGRLGLLLGLLLQGLNQGFGLPHGELPLHHFFGRLPLHGGGGGP